MLRSTETSGNQAAGTENNPYYATHGDFPRYSRRNSSTYTLKSDFSTRRYKQHTLKTIDGHGGVLPATLPWLVLELEETRALMGRDFWPYGVAANKPTLDAMTRWSYEQGLTPRQLAPEDLFVKSTLEQFKV